jgi:hypothetical protein
MKNKSLFTFVVEFRKGTYVSQVKSISVLGALRTWIEEIDPAAIKDLDSKTLDLIREEMAKNEHDKPTRITGMRSAWFTTLLTKKGMFYINIIKTA